MLLRTGALVGLMLLAHSAVAAEGWRQTVERMSEEQQMELHAEVDSRGREVRSRYSWLKILDEDWRPALQTDDELWEKAEIWCIPCSNNPDREVLKHRLFELFKKQRDERNRYVDDAIDRVLTDDSGDYRMQLRAEMAELRSRARATMRLVDEQIMVRQAMRRAERYGED